jgi:hypothetical protein
MSSLPAGTAGVPSCSAASAGKRKSPDSRFAAARPATTPRPTEPNHPLAAEIQRMGPQLPLNVGLLSAGRAEPASAVPSAAVIRNTEALLSVTLRVRLARASESDNGSLGPRRVAFPHAGPGSSPCRLVRSARSRASALSRSLRLTNTPCRQCPRDCDEENNPSGRGRRRRPRRTVLPRAVPIPRPAPVVIPNLSLEVGTDACRSAGLHDRRRPAS